MSDRDPLVIYHANCVDGFTAAWCAWRELAYDVEFEPWNYDDPDPSVDEVRDRGVYILDFSFEPDVVEDMAEYADKVVLLDHHQTAFDRFAEGEFDEPHVDRWNDLNTTICLHPDKSGARMAWDYFSPDYKPLPVESVVEGTEEQTNPPELVRYVEDRDLWNWDLPDSKEINAAIRSYEPSFAKWDQWATSYTEPHPTPISSARWNNHAKPKLRKEGTAILRQQSQQVDRIAENAHEISIDGHDAPAANSSTLQSEIGNELAERAPDSIGVVWFVRDDGDVQVSLRAKDDGPDVAKIAEKYDGGGHPNAAGFSRPTASDWIPSILLDQ